MDYYQNRSTGKIEPITNVTGLMVSSGQWEEYKKLPRYSVETPPYAAGRLEFDEDGEWCRYQDVMDLLEEAKSYLQYLAHETDWDSEGAITELISRMK